jgi:APA family basic amino acid/polyamine antiporter
MRKWQAALLCSTKRFLNGLSEHFLSSQLNRKKDHPGFWTLVFLVVANMIGAGVFTTSGFSLATLGSRELVLWAWCLAGLIALAGAYSYGQLVKAMPESGGEYLFLSRAAHPIFGFIAGWVSLIAGFSGAIAFAAVTLEEYSIPVEIRPVWLPAGSVATLSIVLAAAFHGLRPRAGALIQNSIVVLKLMLLGGILLFAASKFPFGPFDQEVTVQSSKTGFSLATAFANSLVWISLSYSGFNAAVYLAGEVDDREQVVSRSLLVATVFVTIFYLLLNAVFLYANSIESIAGKADIAAITARSLGGGSFDLFVRWTISACLLTSVFSMMMAAPRVYAKMAEDGLLPRVLRFDHNQSASPRWATLLQASVAILLVLSTTLHGLLSYLGLTLSLCAACSVACLLLPAVRKNRPWQPVDLIPLFYIVGTIVSATMLTISNPWQLVGTVATFLAGAVAWLLVGKAMSESTLVSHEA